MTGRALQASIGLKWRIILVVSLLLIISCTSLSIFLISEFSEVAIKGLEHRASSLAKNLAHNSEFGVMLEITPELDAFIEGLLQEEEVLFAQVYNVEGVLLSQGTREGLSVSDIPALRQGFRLDDIESLPRNKALLHREQLISGGEMIDVACPVRTVSGDVSKEDLGSTTDLINASEEQTVVIGFARVGLSLEQTFNKSTETTSLITIFTILVVAVGILLSITLVKMISRPIDRLVEASELIAAGDLSQRVAVAGDKELARLAKAFNKMGDSLESTQKEIQSYNLTLEQKIKERTQKLEEAQQQVVQSEKMAAVGQLAAGVAHELNNPLGGILGYSQFALERLSKDQVSEQNVTDFKRYLTDIETQARRCKMIVKNLLKFSRSSKNSHFELFDLNNELEETFVFVSHQLGMRGINLIKECDPDLPPAYGNPSMLQQVFANLMINGMQSMSEGGELRVSTRYCDAKGEFAGALEISFSDTGMGIPEENIGKIFEPFFTTKKVGEGTGLGLSISYGIVKDHGGDIRIESEFGVGSTFTIVLPIVRETVEV